MSWTESIKDVLARRPYVRGFLLLVGGAAAAQMLPVLAMPLLTRLYSPADFALFGYLVAFLYILGPSVSMRIDSVHLIAEDNQESDAIYMAGIINALVLTVVLLAGALIYHHFQPVNLFEKFPPWLIAGLLVCVLADSAGRNGITQKLRYKQFGSMAAARVTRTVVAVVLQVILGLLAFNYIGLVGGVLVSIVMVLIYVEYSGGGLRRAIKARAWRQYFTMLRKYPDYVFVNGPGTLLNMAMLSLSTIFFVSLYPENIAGQVVLAIRAVSSGLQALREATSRIQTRQMVQSLRESGDSIGTLLRIAGLLSLVAILAASVLVFFGPPLFSFVFGQQWEDAGRYAAILAPAMALAFVVSSLSGTLEAARRVGLFMIWRMLGFTVLLVFFLRLTPEVPIEVAIQGYANLLIILYVILFAFIVYATLRPHPKVLTTTEPESF